MEVNHYKFKVLFFKELCGGYHFARNPEEIFEKFFEQNNPYACLYDPEGKENLGSLLGYSFGG